MGDERGGEEDEVGRKAEEEEFSVGSNVLVSKTIAARQARRWTSTYSRGRPCQTWMPRLVPGEMYHAPARIAMLRRDISLTIIA